MQQPGTTGLTDGLMIDPWPPSRFTPGTGPLRWRRNTQGAIGRARIAALDHREFEAPFNPAPMWRPNARTSCSPLPMAMCARLRMMRRESVRGGYPKIPEREQAGPRLALYHGQHADLGLGNWRDIQHHPNRGSGYSNKKKETP